MSEPTEPTRPLPAAQQPAARPQPQDHPAASPAAGQPPAAPPPGGPSPAGRPPAGSPQGGEPARPPKGPNLWRQATSTTGGTIAAIVASVLTLLLVVGVLGLGAVAVVRTVAGHDGERGLLQQMRERRDDDLPPGQQRRLQNGPMRGDQLPGNGNGNGYGNGKAKAKANGNGLGGLGMGSMMSGIGALGDVQHGEVTVRDSAGKAVVMTVQRGTVTAASATSVTVKSADGFTATYAVDDTTRGRAGDVAKDDAVLVVAQKSGSKAVVIKATRSS
jgi:hypothetical protein